MAMMEVLVGAVAGSVAGAIVGLPMLYAQTRMNRRTETYQRSIKAVSMAWDGAHQAERVIASETVDDALSPSASSRLRDLGSQLAQHGMLCLDHLVRLRIEQAGHLLQQMDHTPTQAQTRIALVAARDAQAVCAAFLRHDRIPPRSPELAEVLLAQSNQ
jgi:hypothetical protein